MTKQQKFTQEQRKAIRRSAWILFSIALFFLLAFVVRMSIAGG